MAFERVPLTSLPWIQGGHPLERKKSWPGRGLTLLELAPGFEDPNVCRNGHAIYVLEGSLALELADGVVERVEPGEACFLDRGTAHRARNAGSTTLLMFVLTP
jgi:hypothetical protein